MPQEKIAELPDITLYRDGLEYNHRETFHLVSLQPRQRGFASIEHVNAMEISQRRSVFWLLFSIVTMPVLVGFFIFLMWVLFPTTVLKVYSEGTPFVMIELSGNHKDDAETMIDSFRRLKRYHLVRLQKAAAA